jgi:arsenical pump membrane protein
VTAADVALLAIAVVGAISRPKGAPAWVIPAIAVVASVLIGTTTFDRARDTLDLLAGPIGFLLAAVPLAVLLDRLGFFEAAAALAGDSRHLVTALWVLAGLVTAVLNLDAAVVLLTPLYIHIARTRGLDPVALAFIPALQACLASSFLPVSNLTNLLAASQFDLTTAQFLGHLALPTIAATGVGLAAHRWTFPAQAPTPAERHHVDRRALGIGGTVVALALVGFSVGGHVGIEPWMVALAADAVLVIALRWVPPLRSVPLDTAVLALSLALLAAGAARHADLSGLMDVTSAGGELRVLGVAAAGAALINNLPAVLVGLSAIPESSTDAVWPLLLGVNIGPLLLLTGSLSNLLWQRAAAAGDVHVGAREFSRVGVRIGLPALVAAAAVRLLVR